MAGRLKQSDDQALLSSIEEEVLSGSFPVIIGHPESWGSDRGQKLLRNLQSQEMIQLNFVDEMHQGLDDHWKKIRPEMKTLTGRLRIFAVRDSPTVAMTATATDVEVAAIIKNLGFRTAPAILKASPVQPHIKFVKLIRPSNNCGSYGRVDKWGNEHPGLISLLRRLYLDKFISNTRLGLPTAKALMMFRTESDMFDVNDLVGSELPHLKG